ncbi:MAG: DUF3516 domain-containing protein [Myxococcota bacterium]
MTITSPSLLSRLPDLGTTAFDPDDVMDRFLGHVADANLELYPAQEEALLELLAGKNVILNTPTGSGKSLVAVALHFKAMCEDRRSFYTSPVKALVNEKFFALAAQFHPDNVGLLTGDATVNPGAPIVCCTAEILANRALREGAAADLSYVVMDEFHFYGDRDRGVAWQIPLLTLPQCRFLLMSATLGDVAPILEAMTARNGHPSVVVTSDQRPVPLTFHYREDPLHEAVAQLIEDGEAPIYLVNFTQKACHEEAQSLTSINLASKDEKRAIATSLQGTRFNSPYGKTVQRFVRHGIGIHHGGMLPRYRRVVERLAKRGLLKVISGTDTLGVGVNVPIRSVLLTKLCKFDGEKMRILSVRDFKQICGRAGRRGYDDHGTVVALAPAHVVENRRLEAKAGGDKAKLRRIVKKKPPAHGFVMWDEATFDKLVGGTPEPLTSRFRVSHAMLLNVLSRPEGGCDAMKRLIRDCHDRDAAKHRHAIRAIGMLRSLADADIVSLVPRPDAPHLRNLEVNVDLQDEFSLNQSLSLFVVAALEVFDASADTYALDVLSLVEAILEDPSVILKKQLDRIKRDALAAMKADGLEYEERMAELEKLDYPKPNAALIHGAYDAFAARNPWLGGDAIAPKGVARELYEAGVDLDGFVIDYKLERSEGTVLRYFSDVYKTLVQSVPRWAQTEAIEDMIDFFAGLVRGVDASLLDEWERMKHPEVSPERDPNPDDHGDEEPEEAARGFSTDTRAFTVAVRNAAFRVVRALALRRYEEASAQVLSPPDGPEWTPDRLEMALAPFFAAHEAMGMDGRARGPQYFDVQSAPDRWTVRQTLVDPDDQRDWALEFTVHVAQSDVEERAVLTLDRITEGLESR